MPITLNSGHALFANIKNALLVDDDDVAKDVVDGTVLTVVGTPTVSVLNGKRHLTCNTNMSGAKRTRTVTPTVFTVMVAAYLRAAVNQYGTTGGVSYDNANSAPYAVGQVSRYFTVPDDLLGQSNNGGLQNIGPITQTGIPRDDVSFVRVNGASDKKFKTLAGEATQGSSVPTYTAASQVFMGEIFNAGRNPSADILHVVVFDTLLSDPQIDSLRADPSQIFSGYSAGAATGGRRRSRPRGGR